MINVECSLVIATRTVDSGGVPGDSDPFQQLGLPSSATPTEVREAWTRLCMAYDADRLLESPNRVREEAARHMDAINEAYATIRWQQVLRAAPLAEVQSQDVASEMHSVALDTEPRWRHRFAGFDRFGHCCLSTCRCGWVGPISQSEDRALGQFVTHVVRSWVRRSG